MDGVLVDARDLHYDALNRALIKVDSKFYINKEEHLSTYDGLPTSKKVQILSENKGLPEDRHEFIWREKQKATIEIVKEEFTIDERMVNILKKLNSVSGSLDK